MASLICLIDMHYVVLLTVMSLWMLLMTLPTLLVGVLSAVLLGVLSGVWMRVLLRVKLHHIIRVLNLICHKL